MIFKASRKEKKTTCKLSAKLGKRRKSFVVDKKESENISGTAWSHIWYNICAIFSFKDNESTWLTFSDIKISRANILRVTVLKAELSQIIGL